MSFDTFPSGKHLAKICFLYFKINFKSKVLREFHKNNVIFKTKLC